MGIIERAAPEIEKFPGGAVLISSLEYLFNWGRASSIWYILFGLACCAIEMMATGASRFDFDRFGIIHRGTPRQSDLMIVSGTVTEKIAERLQLLYEQMPEPKYVLAMGNCAISGGCFYDSYSVVKGVDLIVPVDIYVPGCPPRPEGLLYGILQLQKKIKQQKLKDFLSR